MLILNAYLIIATLADLYWRKVPNWLILATLPYFVFYRYHLFGWPALLESSLLAASVLIVFWLPFIKKGIGAGDIKFLMNLGIALGVEDFLWCFVFGVLCTVPILLYLSFKHKERIFYFLQVKEIMPAANSNDLVKIAYVPPMALGAFIYLNFGNCINPEFHQQLHQYLSYLY